MVSASWESRSVLVTGGAGFIGSHLAEALVKRGARVTILDNLSSGRLDNLQAILDKSVLVQKDVIAAIEQNIVRASDFDVVFHLAANSYVPSSVESPGYDYRNNLETTFALLECLRGCTSPPRLVFASSAAVYGNPLKVPIREDDPTVPISPYGVSKLAAERYVAVYSQLYGVPAVSLRLFSVFGPRQKKQIIYDLFCKLDKDPARLPVLGDGTQERDFNYVDNVVDSFLLVAERAPMRGEVYNVASGGSVTVRELVEAICEVAGVAPQIEYSGAIRPGDAERWTVDISRLRALGYEPKISLHEGLRVTYAWYQTQRGVRLEVEHGRPR